MAKRPLEAKQRARVAKLFRRTPPRYFDLVEWLVSRGHAKTKKQAREMILEKRVKADSHPLGIAKIPVTKPNGDFEEVNIVSPRIRRDLRDRIIVSPKLLQVP